MTISDQDKSMTMGEPCDVPQVSAKYPVIDPCLICADMASDVKLEFGDDSFPITAEWCEQVGGQYSAMYNQYAFGRTHKNQVLYWPEDRSDSGIYAAYEGYMIECPNVKTRGDLRELCRLLGVELK